MLRGCLVYVCRRTPGEEPVGTLDLASGIPSPHFYMLTRPAVMVSFLRFQPEATTFEFRNNSNRRQTTNF